MRSQSLIRRAGVSLRSVEASTSRSAAIPTISNALHSPTGRIGRSRNSNVPMSHFPALTRSFHSTRSVNLASQTVKDPSHPTGIYFHPLPSSNQYAISLLPKSPSSPTSASIIGFIKDQPDSSGEIYDIAVRNPDLVEPHPPFIQLMHDVLKNECVPQDGLLEYEAYLRTDGFAHVADPRHPLMPGRIPTPENIIAMVAFTEGQIRPDSYEPNDVYRIVTSEEGFIQLRPNWLDLVTKRCKEIN
ncbi:uncharacterized protein FA14DRAFT_189549 [Meira miltonrushii]|uniref:Uncharacterized protein n=1 Tax=Meira miltonrushii TaxID=1280837 RepID=A0A316VJC8_9BASI|nr:uncharacterized protein FA14DRAFT_189549 [Meira miltonrushii]PWN35605.1 hypothetical protein FA14DRAFT_189549 [Meira miltonrushii]